MPQSVRQQNRVMVRSSAQRQDEVQSVQPRQTETRRERYTGVAWWRRKAGKAMRSASTRIHDEHKRYDGALKEAITGAVCDSAERRRQQQVAVRAVADPIV